MSFLQALQKRKSGLKVTETVVKTPEGHVFVEKRNKRGEVRVEKVGSSHGYVVDLKPDLQVASVIAGLYMGSQDVAQDKDLLRKHKITHIISVGVQVCRCSEVKHTFIEALDLPEFDMRPVFQQSAELIDDIRGSGGSVFVHCNAGVSRSAAIVIAYIMKKEKFPYMQAFELLKQVRPCVRPNDGFIRQLKLLENDLFCT